MLARSVDVELPILSRDADFCMVGLLADVLFISIIVLDRAASRDAVFDGIPAVRGAAGRAFDLSTSLVVDSFDANVFPLFIGAIGALRTGCLRAAFGFVTKFGGKNGRPHTLMDDFVVGTEFSRCADAAFGKIFGLTALDNRTTTLEYFIPVWTFFSSGCVFTFLSTSCPPAMALFGSSSLGTSFFELNSFSFETSTVV